jgi:signal peptidase II
MKLTPPGLGFLLAALIFALDQASKWAVITKLNLPNIGEIDIIPIFRLIWVNNHGVSLGMFTAGSETQRWALVAVTAIISIGAAIWLARETNRYEALGLGLIVGGAAGNVLDRIRLGYVVDFLNLHFGGWSPFLVFNVSDAAITVGVLVLLARALMAGKSTAELEKTDA